MTKLLLVIAGECFREGTQGSRLRDTDISVINQIKATESHLSFIEHLKKKYNITTDVQLISYASKYENILIDKYNEYNLRYKFYDKYMDDRTQLVNSDKIQNIEEKYDSILVIRPDMCLKPFFFDIFDPYSNQICYPSVCWIGLDRIFDAPRISDTMMFIPKIYFQKIYYDIGLKLYHQAISDYIGNGLNLNDFNVFIKTLHDSDPAKDYNPLYHFVSRKESKHWHSYGYCINNIYLPIETSHNPYDFPDWDLYDDNIDKVAYHQIKNLNNTWEWWDTLTIGRPKFINIIELDIKNTKSEYNPVYPKRCNLETYWTLKDNYQLEFYDENKQLTSVLYKKNDLEFYGKGINHNNHFYLKQVPHSTINKHSIYRNNFCEQTFYTHPEKWFPPRDRIGNLVYSINQIKISGMYMEFGVQDGGSLRVIANNTDKNIKIHAFDCNLGIPESWNGYEPGAFKGQMPTKDERYIFHEGYFEETLPELQKDIISFLHIDCDLYSSTKTIFKYLIDYIVSGTVIVFDEYHGYPSYKEHEYKAFKEFLEISGLKCKCISAVKEYAEACPSSFIIL